VKKDLYHDVAKAYAEYSQYAKTEWTLGYSVIFDLLGEVSGKYILDYGCGEGKFSRFLKKNGASIIGVDVSESMIKQAQFQEKEGIEYRVIESGNLSFIPDKSIDVAVMCFVLSTLNDRKHMFQILQEIYRVLSTDGQFIIMNNNWEVSHGRSFISFEILEEVPLKPGMAMSVKLKTKPPVYLDDYCWPKKFYKELLEEVGFQAVEILEPTISIDDTTQKWLDEKTNSPLILIKSEKPS